MQAVTVVSIEDAGFYADGNVSGSTVKITLQRGDEWASCDGILIWEEEDELDAVFDEWVDCAQAGEEGYAALVFDGDVPLLYGAETD